MSISGFRSRNLSISAREVRFGRVTSVSSSSHKLIENDSRCATRAMETEDADASGPVDVALEEEVATRGEHGRAAAHHLRGMCTCVTCQSRRANLMAPRPPLRIPHGGVAAMTALGGLRISTFTILPSSHSEMAPE